MAGPRQWPWEVGLRAQGRGTGHTHTSKAAHTERTTTLKQAPGKSLQGERGLDGARRPAGSRRNRTPSAAPGAPLAPCVCARCRSPPLTAPRQAQGARAGVRAAGAAARAHLALALAAGGLVLRRAHDGGEGRLGGVLACVARARRAAAHVEHQRALQRRAVDRGGSGAAHVKQFRRAYTRAVPCTGAPESQRGHAGQREATIPRERRLAGGAHREVIGGRAGWRSCRQMAPKGRALCGAASKAGGARRAGCPRTVSSPP